MAEHYNIYTKSTIFIGFIGTFVHPTKHTEYIKSS